MVFLLTVFIVISCNSKTNISGNYKGELGPKNDKQPILISLIKSKSTITGTLTILSINATFDLKGNISDKKFIIIGKLTGDPRRSQSRVIFLIIPLMVF